MVAKIKLVVQHFDRVVTTLIRDVDQDQAFYKTVEMYQFEANDLITKMIEEKNHAGGQNVYDANDDDDEDEDEFIVDSEEEIVN